MSRFFLGGSAHRVTLVSAAAIAVIAIAVCLTIWRYDVAVARWSEAQNEAADAGGARALVGVFWHEREAMDEYLLVPSPAVLAEIRARSPQFQQVAATITPDTPQATRSVGQALAGNAALQAAFTSLRSDAGSTAVREAAALRRMVTFEPGVLQPLTMLSHAEMQASDQGAAAASTAADQALGTGIAAAILAVLSGAAFAYFAVRLLRRADEREEALAGTVGRMSCWGGCGRRRGCCRR